MHLAKQRLNGGSRNYHLYAAIVNDHGTGLVRAFSITRIEIQCGTSSVERMIYRSMRTQRIKTRYWVCLSIERVG